MNKRGEMALRGDIHETIKHLAIPIDPLRPYVDNPRNGDLAAIKKSLLVHGQYRPIVVRTGTNEVLAGNHTYMACMEMGWEQIAATYVDVDDNIAKKIVLVDNRTNDLAKYDEGILTALLQSVDTLSGTGYEEGDLNKLLKKIEGQDESSMLTEKWEIVVNCGTEAKQLELLERFAEEGIECRPLIS